MTTTNSLYRGFGALEFPAAETDETTLASLDPARDLLLDLLAAALNAELGPRWTAASADTPLAGTLPVAATLPHEPTLDTVREAREQLPLLCAFRSGEATFSQHTLWQRKLQQDWEIDYILGPLTTGDERKMADLLIAAAKVIELTIEQGGHRAYATDRPGEASAQHSLVLGAGVGLTGFSALTVRSAQAGAAAFSADAPRYWALTIKMTGVELDRTLDGDSAPLDGATVTVRSGGADGTVDLAVSDTAQPYP